MSRTTRGRNLHQHLVNKAAKYFSSNGYTILKEAKMDGRNRIDVLALKGSERIGIECQLTISYQIIKQKFRNYGSSLTKMIFVVPTEREDKARKVLSKISKEENVEKGFFDIWTEPVDVATTIRLSKKVKARLDKTAKVIGEFRDNYDAVIIKLLDYHDKNQKKGGK